MTKNHKSARMDADSSRAFSVDDSPSVGMFWMETKFERFAESLISAVRDLKDKHTTISKTKNHKTMSNSLFRSRLAGVEAATVGNTTAVSDETEIDEPAVVKRKVMRTTVT